MRFATVVLIGMVLSATQGTFAQEQGLSADNKTQEPQLVTQDYDAMYEQASRTLNGEGVKQDIHEAIRLFTIAAKDNHAPSQRMLGLIYMQGEWRNEKKSHKWIRLAAENNEPYGQLLLGEMYFNGIGVEKNTEIAFQWVERAANQNYADAQYLLGKLYEEGLGIQADPKKAKSLILKAAHGGSAGAQLAVAFINHNLLETEKWLNKAANQEHSIAEYLLGQLYADVTDFENHDFMQGVALIHRSASKAYPKAIEWFKQQEKKGVPEAQHDIGRMFYSGEMVDADYQKAYHWFNLSSNQGLPQAQYMIGLMHYNGLGVPKDMAEAAVWYEKAATSGLAAAQFNLALLYAEGMGVPENYPEALRLYTLAANQGDADAQHNLALMYENGEGTEQNYNKAAELLQLAATQGQANAIGDLGRMYLYGKGVRQDDERAKQLFEQSAQKGSCSGISGLGLLELKIQAFNNPDDILTVAKAQKAIDAFKIGVDKGCAAAEYNLGMLYEMAYNPPRQEEAMKLYLSAAKKRHKKSAERLKSLLTD